MGKERQIRVDESLINEFGRIGKSFADKIKKEYNLDELFVSYPLTSKLVAGKLRGEKTFKFNIRKTGIRKGILELI